MITKRNAEEINNRMRMIYAELRKERLVTGISDYARKIGLYNLVNNINPAIHGSRSFTEKMVDNTCDVFGISKDFVYIGAGGMYGKSSKTPVVSERQHVAKIEKIEHIPVISPIMEKSREVILLEKIISAQDSEITTLKESVRALTSRLNQNAGIENLLTKTKNEIIDRLNTLSAPTKGKHKPIQTSFFKED